MGRKVGRKEAEGWVTWNGVRKVQSYCKMSLLGKKGMADTIGKKSVV